MSEVKTFIVKNVTSHYTKDEFIKRFPNADDYDNFSAQLWGVR